MTLGRELRALDAMNKSRLWMICATLSRELLGHGCFEQLNITNDMNNLVSRELRPLNAMNSSGMWMIRMILYHERRVVEELNDSRS